jgi:hypothetical protein
LNLNEFSVFLTFLAKGWKTVEEYMSDEVASDSEDEKRIRAADNRVVRKIKSVRKDGQINRKRPAEAASQSGHLK